MVIFAVHCSGMADRRIFLLALLVPCCGPLAGCAVPPFGRSVPDMLVSAARGQDCSIVRMEQGKSYCRPPDPPPEPQPFCTRSLATVDCWINPQALTGPRVPVADGPAALTPEQEAYRTRGWLW
jgi:hypothetical protein